MTTQARGRARWTAPGLRPAVVVQGGLLLGALALAGGALASCSRVPAVAGKPDQAKAAPLEPQTVAILGDTAIAYATFQRYLVDNSGDGDEQSDQDDSIKSSLLDQFLEEQLLLRSAEKLRITVSDAEVGAYLEQIGVTEGEADVAGGEGKDAFRAKVRQSLIVQKVKDQAVLSKVEVSPGEIEDQLKKQPELQRTPRAVVLRQILVDDRSLAERLASDLAKDPARFEAVARANSVAPDRGQARAYTEEELPVELRAPLFALRPGETSPALEHAQRWLIFQLVRSMEAGSPDLAEARQRVRLDLFRAKGEQALERFIADLKSETEIRVNPAILPFKYTGDYRN